MNTKRVNELVAKMTAGGDEKYYKGEVLSECQNFENQVLEIAFPGETEENAKRTLSDACKRLQEDMRGGVKIKDKEALEAMESLSKQCIEFEALIGCEYSGNKGEKKVQRNLEAVSVAHRKIFNLELRSGNQRGELDAVIITSKGIFLIETKNPSEKMHIDEKGNYYAEYRFMNSDYNIGEKFNNKESLVRNILRTLQVENGKKINLIDLVVIANSKVHVSNRYKYIELCRASQLPHIIDDYEGVDFYSEEEMFLIEKTLIEAECKEKYPINFDFAKFKRDFAVVISAIEEAEMKATKKVELQGTLKVKPKTVDGEMQQEANEQTRENFLDSTFESESTVGGESNKQGRIGAIASAVLVAGTAIGTGVLYYWQQRKNK